MRMNISRKHDVLSSQRIRQRITSHLSLAKVFHRTDHHTLALEPLQIPRLLHSPTSEETRDSENNMRGRNKGGGGGLNGGKHVGELQPR